MHIVGVFDKQCIVVLMMFAGSVQGQSLEECMNERMINANPTMTLGELEEECNILLGDQPEEQYSAALERVAMEQRTEWNPFVITPHNSNYFLPYTYVKDINTEAYRLIDNFGELDNTEAKMQFSFKVPLYPDDLFVTGDAIYFAFTLKSFWQIYNHELSAPFRETNYRPEFFYRLPIMNQLNDRYMSLDLGLEHESNGRSQVLSRSWNRIFVNYTYAKDNYMIQFRPWYRIPEKEKDQPWESQGDDNPDIHEYMGYFELLGVWEQSDYEFSVMFRNNLKSDNKGAIELDASFPLWGRLRGLVQYFNGYGESLIDYDHKSQRIGFGILITDLL